MNSATARQVFEGLMLGDGTIVPNGASPYFALSLSGEKHMSYLTLIHDTLELLGMDVVQPTARLSISKGKPYMHCRLRTLTSPALLLERERWYPNGSRWKVVPGDIHLQPATVAHWFMGDGYSSYRLSGSVYARLCTEAFSAHGVNLLRGELAALGIGTTAYEIKVAHGDGFIINIKESSMTNFMRMVAPYIVEPFMYKVKYKQSLR